MRYLVILILLSFCPLPLLGQSIPEAIVELGFTEGDLINYFQEDNKELFTFLDNRTESPEDVVIFTIEDGQIKETKTDSFTEFDYTDQLKESSQEIEEAVRNFKDELLKEVEPASYSDIMGE